MKHIDLFSGIGGFSYAADQVWDNVEHIFCEIDPFCQAVLNKHWKGSVIYGDIEELIADAESGERNGRMHRPETFGLEWCDLLTGGFPCQPFSHAGKRKGTDDDRHLWPKMFRVIQLTKPTWVVAENVRGLLTIEGGVVFEQMCLDLEREGYEVQPFIIPACAVNAPHRRDRVWIVANRKHERCVRGSGRSDKNGNGVLPDKQTREEARSATARCDENAPDTKIQRREQPRYPRSGRTRLQDDSWSENWLEVATELCRVDDGPAVELDGLKLTKAGHRVERLKALGNSIVPQVVVEIFKAIRQAQ